MARQRRNDEDGGVYHVMNRGLARRRIMEADGERRYFLSRIARSVRKGWIVLHAYCLLDNHYHLLVESRGKLSQCMCWVESQYVRRFNLARGRDGPLFRARFQARRVNGEEDFRNVVLYIEANPVVAGLVAKPEDYCFASARHHASREPRPRWLHRAEVERVVGHARSPGSDDLRGLRWRMERRFALPVGVAVPAAPPVHAGRDQAREWLRREASADGWVQRAPLLAPVDVSRAVDATRATAPGRWPSHAGGGRVTDAWLLVEAGILRAACGLTFREIARLLEISETSARARCARHAFLMRNDPLYAARAGEVLCNALK